MRKPLSWPRHTFLFAAILSFGWYEGASQFSLVRDINSGSAGGFPNRFISSGGQLFFLANDGEHGFELWTTNGTTAGTHMVSDINPGNNSGVSVSSPMVVHNGKLYFLGNDGVNGTELWSSNGTLTELVDDMRPGPNSNHIFYPTVVNNRLIFQANPIPGDVEWWKVDNGNTVSLIKEIVPGPGGAALGQPLIGPDYILFEARDGSSSVSQLWVTDGTEAGTSLVDPELDIGSGGGVAFNGYVFFFAQGPGTDGFELFKGDASGASMVRNINEDEFGGGQPKTIDFHGIVYKTNLYFNAYDPVHGDALWKTDGTGAGTNLVKDFYPGSDPDNGLIGMMTVFNDYIYFVAEDEEAGLGLWRSDGTSDGTTEVMAFLGISGGFYELDQKLYFIGNDGDHGNELWESDGTTLGTKMVVDFAPGIQNGVSQLTAFADKVFLAADGPLGNELYVYTPQDCEGPVITEHPIGGVLAEGDDFTLTVSAAGANLSYQWLKDGITIVGATSTSYTILQATSAAKGSYLCRVTNDCATIESDVALVSVDAVVGVEKQRNDEITVFPNPAGEWCRLELRNNPNQSRAATVELRNAVGGLVKVFSADSVDTLLDLSDIPPGIYTLKMKIWGYETAVKRLVVQP